MSYLAQMRAERRNDRWTEAQIKQSEQNAAAVRRREAEEAAERRRLADAQIKQSEKDAAARRRREAEDAAAQRRRADRAEAAKAAAARRAESRAARRAWFARLPDYGMAALWATMIVLPITLAWQAQALFAHEVLRFAEPFNHGFPAAVELAAWLCAFEARRRIQRGDSAGLLPTWMWLLAGSAAVINGGHGFTSGGPVAGLSLAFLSVLGVALHSIRQGLDAARVSGNGHARLALWRRLRYPRLSIAAASLRAARELTPADAWQLAWIDRYGVGPDCSRRDRRLARLVVRRAVREDRKAVKTGDVTIVDGKVQKGFAALVREHVDREREDALAKALAIQQGAQDALNAAGLLFGPDVLGGGFGPDGTGANQGAEQGDKPLSQRAAEILPALQEAIQAGAVPTTPGVKTIQRWVKNALREPLGTPVAMELRDRVSGLRVVSDGSAADGAGDADDRKEDVA